MTIKFYAIGGLILVSNLCYSADDIIEFHCPTTAVIDQKIVLKDNAGDWIGQGTSQEHNYVMTWLSTNPNESRFRLRPDRKQTSKYVTTEQYDLPFYRNKGNRLYVVCEFTQSTATIFKSIPSKYNHCELQFEKKDGLDIEKGVTCNK